MSQNKNNPLKQEKIRKREDLLNLGVDPYPPTWKNAEKRILSSQLLKELETGELKKQEEDVSKKEDQLKESKSQASSLNSSLSDKVFHIAGRLMRKRPMGKAAFFNIQDQEGSFQCYIKKEDFSNSNKENTSLKEDAKLDSLNQKDLDKNSSEITSWNVWKLADIGDILAISGRLFRTKKGEPSLRVQNLQILCKTLEPLPEKYHGLEDKELKYRYRHLDLIMDSQSRKVFSVRSKIIHEIRSFMNNKGFMEVETPTLQPIYGGAEAFPFETYFRRLNQKMYLKISPEIYLKKLIVGGFEKVFEIGKNFRNEGLDRTHNPEFTMMEYYEAYTDYKYQMNQFESLVCYVVQQIKGSLKIKYQGRELDFTPPWTRITVKEAIKKYSKSENGLNEVTAPDEYKKIVNKYKSIDVDTMNSQQLLEVVYALDPKGDFERFKKTLKSSNVANNALEDLKDELIIKTFELLVERHLWNPTFVQDFPIGVSPLTKKHRDKSQTRLVERFEPYIAGMELGNAYTELNDPVAQRDRLKKQQRWSDNSDIEKENKKNKKNLSEELNEEKESAPPQPIDENFLNALEVGMPPVGGVGLGIERLVMILTDSHSIKDSMLFPMLKERKE